MKKIYRIYRYTNILNGMKYHGKTCRQHQSTRTGKNGKRYVENCPRFGEAIKEYGWSNFKYEVLEDGLTKEEAEVREQYWIEKENSIWPNGYNVTLGGDGTKGVHRVFSDEWRKKHSEAMKGKQGFFKGKHHTEEARKKISETGKGRTPWNKGQGTEVLQFTKDGQFVAKYSSASEAERQTGIIRGSILRCCKGERRSAGGSIWKYA
jgi:group I intron endonuclease